ncbi:WYL domain-containing protein [Mycolicibacillus koreensis]|nr:WYL domain-containing protein [Mycolicibacillus koreensis]
MAKPKVERLLNLVIALLSTRGYLTAEKIRASVVGYDNASDEAFARMFERDKAELRELGIPLEVGRASASDPIEGYRITSDDYKLPEITLSAGEAAAVAVAAQLWETPELITATQGALLKLRAAGVDVDPDASTAIAPATDLPGLRGGEEVLGALLAAVDAGQPVAFDHRPSRGRPVNRRTVEPWGVLTAHGRWYLVGHDRDRDDTRVFRVSRIVGAVEPVGPAGVVTRPEGADLRAIVTAAVSAASTEEEVTARLWVADGRATGLRRFATVLGAERRGDRDGELMTVTLRAGDQLTRLVAGYGADAVVLEPPALREEVLARLHANTEVDQ